MAKAIIATSLALGAVTPTAKWYDVDTDSDTTAEVRAVFVERLLDHRQDVADHKAHLAALRRLAERAAQDAQDAAEALGAAPVPSYPSGPLTAAQVAGYARSAGFPEWAIPQMVAYAARESGFNPSAINPTSGACGLWQIYPPQYGCTDPATNARMAYEKFQAAGFAPWGG